MRNSPEARRGAYKAAVPAEAADALRIARGALGDALIAAYLHGSAMAGGLRPDSDVDVLGVVDRPMSRAVREQLAAGLMEVSGRPRSGDGARPVELFVLHRDELRPSAYPRRSAFLYGEWLRCAFEAGASPEPGPDPELSIVLAQARAQAISLLGPEPAELLPVIERDELRRAIGDLLPALIDSAEGDERNVLLTLARMWRTLTTGEIVSKDVAAEWARARLSGEAAALMDNARDAYIGAMKDDWRPRRRELRRTIGELRARVAAAL